VPVNLERSADDEAFRVELIAFIEQHAPPEVLRPRDFEGAEEGEEIIPEWSRRWQATLFDHGWMIPGYPPEMGGRNATPSQTLVYLEELAERGIRRSQHFPGYAIVGPSLLQFGTEEQRAWAPAAIRGDTVWCVGMSEPSAGSDLAGLRTRGVRDGDHFVVNGQKVWTSYATVAQKCFCYVRTDPDVAKHKGISVLIVDMDTPGIDVRPLRHLSGAAEFAEVFFDDVRVPVTNLVGDLNDGWRITMGSLAHERGGLWIQGVAALTRAVDDLAALAHRYDQAEEGATRRRIAELYERARTVRALGYKGFAAFSRGEAAPEHAFMKMATSELGKEIYETAMEIMGPSGALTGAEEQGRWQRAFLVSMASTIAAGTSEIQRNIIATRVLGLPRGTR
jgi:alkylation response protein AidB-like acyl-CoA dehydrogenase